MNPALTTLVTYPSKQRPLMLDNIPAPTDPDAGPFLITSSRSLMWVDRAFPSGFLRVAIREVGPTSLFGSMIEAIADKGTELKWGNILRATSKGIKDAVAHLAYYDITDVEILHGDQFTVRLPPGIEGTCVPWMPHGWAAVVPVDRSYVGTVYDLGDGHVGGVIHNASRGVAILR